MIFGHSNKIRLTLCNPMSQRLLLIALVVFVFWNGLWGGVPRADHCAYLHRVSQFTNFRDIILNSPSWNRTQSVVEDFILFRPLLFIQLGSFYYFFGYNFFLWQAASLILHILVVLGLHSLLLQGSLKNTLYPLLISALFGCSYLGAELVLWNHISGYITFSALATYSVLFLIKFLSTGKQYFGWLSLSFGILSEITYELGFVLNLLIATALFYVWLIRKAKKSKSQFKVHLKWIFLFSCGSLLYPVLSIFDLWVRGFITSFNSNNLLNLNSISLATWFATKQIGFWLGGWVLSSAYDVHAAGRASFSGFRFSGTFFLANVTAAIGLLFVAIQGLKTEGFSFFKMNHKAWLSVFCALVFLFSYSFVIAYGRALPRGLDYVFGINIYYSYIAQLSIAIGLSLIFLKYSSNNIKLKAADSISILVQNKKNIKCDSALLIIILIALIAFNSYYTHKLASEYRFNYSPPRQEVINAVECWLRGDGKSKNAYFKFDSNCAGNEKLSWFDGHFRKNTSWSGPVNLADVLWPDKSFLLNEKQLVGTDYSIFNIKCTQITASSKLNEFGPEGLGSALNPAWHAALPVRYPQILDVDFGHERIVRQLLFLAQEGLSTRAPSAVRIEGSNDTSKWQEVFSGKLDFSRRSYQWSKVTLTKPVELRYLRIFILSNCGDPTYLTLRGLRFD